MQTQKGDANEDGTTTHLHKSLVRAARIVLYREKCDFNRMRANLRARFWISFHITLSN